jgi:RNA polymerase sigma-70 factor (ECF subfamily)
MSSPPPTFGIDELLAHADWLRRLALHVVRGPDGEDVLQETWVAALRSPPRRDRAAEPWLAEVLRNFARRALRTDTRARRRESGRDAVAPSAATTPDVLLERAEAQRLLAELVMALDEPFRSTVLLRYFEGLSAADIARTQEIPRGPCAGASRRGSTGCARPWTRATRPSAGPGRSCSHRSRSRARARRPAGLEVSSWRSEEDHRRDHRRPGRLLAGGLIWRGSSRRDPRRWPGPGTPPRRPGRPCSIRAWPSPSAAWPTTTRRRRQRRG